jgi:acetyl esterase/lipase
MNKTRTNTALALSSTWWIWCATASIISPLLAEELPRVQTYVYKRVGPLDIHADVYRFTDETMRPAVVWIHGGALIVGNRAGISDPVRQMATDNGYVLVSIDYRLAPETKLPEIIQDVEDAFRWLRTDGPNLFGVDPNRIAVVGSSAGGYLTLTSGFRVTPRPRVLVSFFGYGDLVGAWYSQPSPHPRHHQSKLGSDAAWRQVSGPPISDSRNRAGDGGAFYQYCRQQGTWPQAVSDWDPHTEAERFFPFMAVKNVTRDFPPTVLIHGTEDTDVPYEQSVMMAKEFESHGVEYELLSIKGAEHGLGGGDPQEVAAAYRGAFEFLKRHLEK